jgi:hypothetical protein
MMEPRELYGPEDIEQLLIERSYDDLLEEERAFVLRHLSDRAEYQRMRALLLRVHEDDRPVTDLDADPAVRENVMAAFRAQQQPQWRIWLNSVGGFFIPREPAQFWKPALAFGTLALLVTVGVIGLRNLDVARNAEMAEVRPAPAKNTNEPIVTEKTTAPAAPKVALETALEAQTANESAAATTASATADADKVSNVEVFSDASVAEAPVAGVAADEVASELKKEAVLEPNAAGKVALDMADTTVPFTTTTGHTVDQAELTRNATIADVAVHTVTTARAEQATSKAMERKMERDKGKAQKDDQRTEDVTAYLGLLRAAW